MAQKLVITVTIDQDGMEEMDDEDRLLLDLSHPMGVTNEAYEDVAGTVKRLAEYGEVEFKVVG